MKPSKWYVGRFVGSLILAGGILLSGGVVLGNGWMEALKSGSQEEMAYARHIAPFDGVGKFGELLELVGSPDTQLARTAELIALDIAAETTAHGREDDRRVVTEHIDRFLQSAESLNEKIVAMRLFSRTVTVEHPVDNVVALLSDEHEGIRGRARETLEELGSPPARAALREMVSNGPREDRLAAARSLGLLGDTDSVEYIRPLLREGSEVERASASLSLAEIVGSSEIKSMLDLWREMPEGNARDIAASAVLRLGQRLEESGNGSQALPIYLALAESRHAREVVAGYSGISRVGSGGDISTLKQGLHSDDGRIRLAALAALGRIDADDATLLLVNHYDDLIPSERGPAIVALRQRGDDRASDLFQREVESEDADLQKAAVEALGYVPSVNAIEALSGPALSSEEALASAARESLLRVASVLGGMGYAEEATKAYVVVAESPGASNDQRRMALSGMLRSPSVEAFDAVMAMAEEDALRAEVTGLLIELAAIARVQGDIERANEARDRAFGLDDSGQLRERYLMVLMQMGINKNFDSFLSPLREWQVLGPFRVDSVQEAWNKEFIDPTEIDLDAKVEYDGDKLEWVHLDGQGPMGHVNLLGRLAEVTNAFAFGYTTVISPKRQLAHLRVGTDDGVTVWLNGWQVHDNNAVRPVSFDSDIIPIRLEEGENTILLRVSQHGGGFSFQARLTDRDGNAIKFEEIKR
ncbi:MAG: HEAT repeat domain-containing protein [Candidatus Sumerlaeia bacterium]|nr:HEAT repeat domain-containing protein [Candidatus Sumerlaeia bacterium]